MGKYKFARVTGGGIFENIDLYGRINEEKFLVLGCKDEDQERFYQAILEDDNKNQVHGFKNVEEVKQYWEEDGDMFLTIEEGQYKIVELEYDFEEEEKAKKHKNEIIDNMISFLQDEGDLWDKDTIKKEFAYRVMDFEGCELDEIDLVGGRKSLITLDEFADQYFDNVLEGICNVLKSFKSVEGEKPVKVVFSDKVNKDGDLIGNVEIIGNVYDNPELKEGK